MYMFGDTGPSADEIRSAALVGSRYPQSRLKISSGVLYKYVNYESFLHMLSFDVVRFLPGREDPAILAICLVRPEVQIRLSRRLAWGSLSCNLNS